MGLAGEGFQLVASLASVETRVRPSGADWSVPSITGWLVGAGENRLMTLSSVARQTTRAAGRPKEKSSSRSMHPTQLLTGNG